MKKSQVPSESVLYLLSSIIRNNDFFVSGSFANPNVSTFNDIDVFFHSKRDYEAACSRVKYLNRQSRSNNVYDLTMSNNAMTFVSAVHNEHVIIQLVNKHFGTVDEIFSTFDLNICKHALLPNGMLKSCPSTSQPLHLVNVTSTTFNRVLKYFQYINNGAHFDLKPDQKAYVYKIIDHYISNSTIVEDYYQEENFITINKAMYNTYSAIPHIKSYLQKQALSYAPELLI
jgi:hypothetical protein